MSPAVPKMTWADVRARRLRRHGLAAPFTGAAAPADVASAMAATHAQVMSAAELAIGLRLDGATRSDVRAALWQEHSLIKTFGPRGTVHLLPARDLGMWVGALSALASAPTNFPPDLRLTPGQAEEVVAAIAAALTDAGPAATAPAATAPAATAPAATAPAATAPATADAGPAYGMLTIDELGDEVVKRTGPWAGDLVMPAFQGMWPRWRQAMHLAGMRGALCFGPNRGRKVTYASPRRWLPEFRAADARPALAWAVRRYLHAYGPSTPQRFANWLAIPAARGLEIFASLGSELQRVEVEGALAWVTAGDAEAPPGRPAGVRLLPYFDGYSYRVGIQCPELLYPGPAAERVRPGAFQNLVVNGVVAGLWQQRRSGRRIDITVEPLVPLSAAQRAELDEQAERVGAILEGKAHLAIGTVTVGAHA
jgi:hypothetical protein